jgi:hypothetical protein
MSLFANAYGNFLSTALPYYQSMPGIITPYGTLLKPGGRIAAYVRSTGAQDGEDHFAQSGMLVSTINAGLQRCRSGQNDIVYVLPGHTETYSSSGAIWANLVAGAQIIGVGTPGATNNPNVTLAHTGASMALNVANVTVSGLNINTATASTTGFIVVTGAGCTMAGNFINITAALGANPAIAVTGAANFHFVGNHVVADCTDPIIEVTGAGSTNMEVVGNFLRQSQGTSGGSFIALADTAGISGIVGYNVGKIATAGTPGTGFDLDATNVVANVLNVENYCTDNVATTGIIATGAAFS